MNLSNDSFLDIDPDENIINQIKIEGGDLSSLGTNMENWFSLNNKDYFFNYKSIPQLPSGLYSITFTEANGFGVSKMSYKSEDYFTLPSLPHEEIISDIKKFWDNKGNYEKYNITTKRGIILHGDPGGGKTSLIYLLIEEMKKYNGISIYFDSPKTWIEVAKLVRKIEPERPILCIIEDIDGVINMHGEEIFLNFLDGLNSVSNIVYVATTNNIVNIPDRIKNRPSRFDKKYEVKKPTEEDRNVYFNHMVHDEDKAIYDIAKLAKDTNGLSMAHLKELFISLYIFKNEYKKALADIKKGNITDKAIGFNINSD